MKHSLSAFLAFALVFSLFSTQVFAEKPTPQSETTALSTDEFYAQATTSAQPTAATLQGFAVDANNFPDTVFRAYIAEQFDSNQNGKLEAVELDQIDFIAIPSEVQNVAGLELFTEITYLSCIGNKHLTEIDLSKNTKLEHLYFANSSFVSLDLRYFTELQELSCENNRLTALLLPQKIGKLNCDNNQLAFLDLDNTSIEVLSCNNNDITALNLTKSSGLRKLSAKNNRLTRLDCSEKKNLLAVECDNNPLAELNLAGCSSLLMLSVIGNHLPMLNLQGMPDFQTLNSSQSIKATAFYQNRIPVVNFSQIVGKENIKNVSFSAEELKRANATYDETTASLYPPAIELSNQTITYSYATGNSAVPKIEISLTIHIPQAPPVPLEPVTSNPTGPTASEPPPTHADPVEAFVERIYQTALERPSDAKGLAHWAQALKSKQATGSAIISYFFLSSEFTQKGHSNEKIMELVYSALLNRTPDAGGKSYWAGNLNAGVSLTGVLASFVTAPEFKQICDTYEIEVGTIGVSEPRDKSPNLTKFIARMYNVVLQRTADVGGLNYWAEQMQNGTLTAEEVAHDFVFSKEYVNRKANEVQYINMLYRSFMGREPEAAGFTYWQEQLSAGVSREQVFKSFASSAEFKQIQKEFGI